MLNDSLYGTENNISEIKIKMLFCSTVRATNESAALLILYIVSKIGFAPYNPS